MPAAHHCTARQASCAQQRVAHVSALHAQCSICSADQPFSFGDGTPLRRESLRGPLALQLIQIKRRAKTVVVLFGATCLTPASLSGYVPLSLAAWSRAAVNEVSLPLLARLHSYALSTRPASPSHTKLPILQRLRAQQAPVCCWFRTAWHRVRMPVDRSISTG